MQYLYSVYTDRFYVVGLQYDSKMVAVAPQKWDADSVCLFLATTPIL